MFESATSHLNLRLPPWAAWQHLAGQPSLEVVFIRPLEDGVEFEGITSGGHDGQSWRVDYRLAVDRDWTTRAAQITSRNGAAHQSIQLDAAEDGSWRVDGRTMSEVRGCLDVDLETSALTNALPIRRLGLVPGETAEAPAVYVRGPDLRVERLEQRYHRLPDEDLDYHYEAPRFAFEAILKYDRDGLVRDYPGIARRAL